MNIPRKLLRRHTLHQINISLCCLVLIMIFGNIAYNELSTVVVELISPQPVQVFSYKISPGDTLWTVAGRAVRPGEDIREKIIAIRKQNGLTPNQVLFPGQIVQIPMKNIGDTDFRYTLKTP